MASLAQWVAGARPRTLPAAVAPVVLGTAAAHLIGAADLTLGVLALLVALSLQVGVNYANDYSDGIRGTDEARVGPVRLVGQRLAAPTTGRPAGLPPLPLPRPPAGRTPTATAASASSTCSSSSASWPPSARSTPRRGSSRGSRSSAPSESGPWLPPSSWPTTCVTSRQTPSTGSGPSPCGSATAGSGW